MNEAEIRTEIAASVVAITNESDPVTEGPLTVIDFGVLYTVDGEGATKAGAQRVHILNRGHSTDESATYGTRRFQNYVAPVSPAAWFLSMKATIIASISNAAEARIADMTPNNMLPVQILNSAGAVLDKDGNVDATNPWYLVVPTSATTWTLELYTPGPTTASV